MNKKIFLIALLALFVGIGGTAAYFWLHSLYVAHTAPPIPPASQPAQQQSAQSVQQQPALPAAQPATPPVQQQAAAPSQQPVVQGAPSNGAATLDNSQLVLAGISYGASIDAVRQTYGEPREIDQDYKPMFQGPVMVYEYRGTFDLYVVNNTIQRIKVDDLNGLGTSRGIVVGSSANDVVAAYGQPNAVLGDHYIYRVSGNPTLGLDFEMAYSHVEKIKCGILGDD